MNRVPRDIHWFVRGLTIVEDQLQKPQQFWFIWNLFASRIRTAPWIAHMDDRYPSGDELMSAIFLGSWWKDDVRHWKSLEGHADHVHRLSAVAHRAKADVHQFRKSSQTPRQPSLTLANNSVSFG